MGAWRFYLLTMPGRVWVDEDLQFEGAEVIESLSAPASISGTLPLGHAHMRLPGGELALREWGSAIVAEQGGRDPLFAIVDSISTEGDKLSVSAGGFAMYPKDMPWVDAEYSGIQVDPLDIVRMIWAKLQAQPDGDLGVVVDALKSSVRIGTPEDPKLTVAKARYEYMKDQLAYTEQQAKDDAEVLEQRRITTLSLAGLPKDGLIMHSSSTPADEKRSKKNLWIDGDKDGVSEVRTWNGKKWVDVPENLYDPIVDAFFDYQWNQEHLKVSKKILADTKKKTSEAKSKVNDLREGEAVPYRIAWWEHHDLGQLIDDLAAQTPFDYREVTRWSGEELVHRLELGAPKLGTRRDQLRFEVGVNVTIAPPVQERDYASEVIVLGAGEGRAMVRAAAVGNPGRLRRAVVVEKKDRKNKFIAGLNASSELRARAAEWVFDTLEILDHPSAPYGSFDTGDEIYVTGDAGWVQLDHWVRVKEIATDCTTGKITLKVEVS